MHEDHALSLGDVMKAQQALRSEAGLPPERFPLQAFVGMVSDEIDALRRLGRSDGQIAAIIKEHSGIDISADQLRMYYAPQHARERPSP